MKKLISCLKCIAKFIRKVLRKILAFVSRFAYSIILVGYLAGFVGAYVALPYITNYNNQALEFNNDASKVYKSYQASKNIESIIKQETTKTYKKIEDTLSSSIKSINERKLAKELLLGKKLEKTSAIKDLKADLKSSLKIDVKATLNKNINKQETLPFFEKLSEFLSSKTAIMVAMLLIIAPAFSPIVLAVVVALMFFKRYIKHLASANENNYLTMLTSIYLTNLILSILTVVVFYFNNNAGFVLAIITHGLFLMKVINGIRLKNLGVCLACNQKIAD